MKTALPKPVSCPAWERLPNGHDLLPTAKLPVKSLSHGISFFTYLNKSAEQRGRSDESLMMGGLGIGCPNGRTCGLLPKIPVKTLSYGVSLSHLFYSLDNKVVQRAAWPKPTNKQAWNRAPEGQNLLPLILIG